METKEEIKKAFLTEPIKFAIQTALVFVATLIPVVFPYVREIILPTRGSVWFDVGRTQKLLLCLIEGSEPIAVDNHHATKGFSFKKLSKGGKGFNASVRLLGDGQWVQDYKITVRRDGTKKWNVTQIIEGSGFANLGRSANN